MDWITNLFDIKKIPTRVIILALVISFFLLFLPDEMIKNLELIQFKMDYGKYFGIIFLVSAGLLIMQLISWIYNKINEQRLKSKKSQL